MRIQETRGSLGRVLPISAAVVALAWTLSACSADPESGDPVSAPSAQVSADESDGAGAGGDIGAGNGAGNDGDNDGGGGNGSDSAPDVDTSNSVLPSVQVKDVAGGDLDLAGLVPSENPILLWAWAPHCPICAAEAPAVEEFSKQNASTVTVVGIGTQDDLALAEDFVSTYGVSTPQMLWDPGFESWKALEITGQPTWVLLSPGGEEIGRWQGGLPADEILSKV